MIWAAIGIFYGIMILGADLVIGAGMMSSHHVHSEIARIGGAMATIGVTDLGLVFFGWWVYHIDD